MVPARAPTRTARDHAFPPFVSETHIDVSHTAGATLVAESGHDYSISAVPGPATWLMLLAGLATPGALVRRRA